METLAICIYILGVLFFAVVEGFIFYRKHGAINGIDMLGCLALSLFWPVISFVRMMFKIEIKSKG